MKTNILKAALFTPMADGVWGLPVNLWGAPGVAKTATIKALGRAYGFHVEHLAPGERGEGAFGVTPVPTGTGAETVLRYPPPEWTQALVQKGIDGKPHEVGIVFADELTTAPPAIQPALLGLVQERRIGGHTLGPRVRVLAAANPVAQAAGGWDLAAPVANRMGHIDWPAPDAEAWAAWLVSGGAGAEVETGDAVKEEARVLAAWPTAFAKASGLVSAFLRRRPELLHKMPGDGDPAQSRAWPSPRTWEYATRALASAEVHGLNQIDADELVAAFVGAAAAGELATWTAQADLPDPVAVLDGKAKFEHSPERLDRTEAVLNACAALVAPKGADKRQPRASALWKLIGEVMKDAKDVVVPSVAALNNSGLASGDEANAVLAKLYSVVQAAGLKGGSR